VRKPSFCPNEVAICVAKTGGVLRPSLHLIPGLKPIQLSKPDLDGGKSVWRHYGEERRIGTLEAERSNLDVVDLLWRPVDQPKEGPFGIPEERRHRPVIRRRSSFSCSAEGFTSMNRRPSSYTVVAGTCAHGLGRGREDGSHGTSPVDLRRGSRKIQPGGFQEPACGSGNAKAYYFVDTGLMAGNVYLFAASQGLSAWFHNCDKAGLHARLKLKLTQRVLFGQTIGYSSA